MFGRCLQGHRVVDHDILHWQEREENRVSLVGLRVSIVLRTLSKRRCASRKRRNFSNISLSPVFPLPLLCASYYSLLISWLLLYCCSSCHIGCSPSCISRQPTFLVEPQFVKKSLKKLVA